MSDETKDVQVVDKNAPAVIVENEQQAVIDKPLNYESWLPTQPDEIQKLITSNVAGLKAALNDERKLKKGLQKSLKELQGNAENNTELQKQLQALEGQLETSQIKTEFLTSSSAMGITDSRLAFLAAESDNLFRDERYRDRAGNIIYDKVIEQLKESYPALFSGIEPTPTKGNAGVGTVQPKDNTKIDMNRLIRRQAGFN